VGVLNQLASLGCYGQAQALAKRGKVSTACGVDGDGPQHRRRPPPVRKRPCATGDPRAPILVWHQAQVFLGTTAL